MLFRSGYFDVYADIAVTVQWFQEGETVLAWLSVSAIALSVLVQWVLVDRTARRRLMSLLQCKILVDAINSLRGGSINAGYATAKFSEAVYEATTEVTHSRPPHATSCFLSFLFSTLHIAHCRALCKRTRP